MKKILVIVVMLMSMNIYAQRAPESKPDFELTKEEATLRIQDWEMKVKDLETKLASLQGDVTENKRLLDEAIQALKDCKKNLNDLIEATDAEVSAFRERFGKLEAKVRQLRSLSNDEIVERRAEVLDLQKEYIELQHIKIAILPEFYSKMVKVGNDIDYMLSLEKKVTTYTVGTWAENRDCLWNISGKMEIFGDPSLWPKIWQANKDIIRNPDIIHPGQVLTLPAKSAKDAEELKAERKYYRMKREAAATNAETGAPTSGK